jgi:hypothetical protein
MPPSHLEQSRYRSLTVCEVSTRRRDRESIFILSDFEEKPRRICNNFCKFKSRFDSATYICTTSFSIGFKSMCGCLCRSPLQPFRPVPVAPVVGLQPFQCQPIQVPPRLRPFHNQYPLLRFIWMVNSGIGIVVLCDVCPISITI